MNLRLWRAGLILCVGAALGLAWNAISGHGLPLDRNAFVQEGDELIEPAEAKKRVEHGALLLDARPRTIYDFKRIDGAASLPSEPDEDFERAFRELEPALRSHFEIVVYCNAGCEASHIAARKLKSRGIPAAILKDGIEAWEEAGYPLWQAKP